MHKCFSNSSLTLYLGVLFAMPVFLWGCGGEKPSPKKSQTQNTQLPGHASLGVGGQAAMASLPIVLRNESGVTIRGRTISDDLSIKLHDCDNITLIDCDLRRIELTQCSQVKIVNCFLHDSAGNAIYLDGCSDVLVQGNRIERVRTGILAHRSQAIRIIGNYCEDVQGPMPGGQFVQFDKVTGSGNIIADNYAVNFHDASTPEDMISIYQSRGTRASPILIENNYLTGDPERGSEGKSSSGSGIMLGDDGGAWQTCRNNTLINPGQVGIGIASGEFITVENNLILGESSDVVNVGLYAWNQYDRPAGRVTLRHNTIAWVNANGGDNPYWDGGGFTQVVQEDNTFGGRALLDSIEIPEPPSERHAPPVPYVEEE